MTFKLCMQLDYKNIECKTIFYNNLDYNNKNLPLVINPWNSHNYIRELTYEKKSPN